MHAEPLSGQAAQMRQGASRLGELASFAGDAQEFWPSYLEAVGSLLLARRVVLLARDGERRWQLQREWPASALDQSGDALRILGLADQALDASPWIETVIDANGHDISRMSDGQSAPGLAVRVPADTVASGQHAVVVVLPADESGIATSLSSDRVALMAFADLLAAVPAQYAKLRALSRQAADPSAGARLAVGAERLYDVIELSVRMGGQTRFMKAALTLANELAVRFGCDRVSLGWIRGREVRLKSVSHVEKFDRLANASRELEAAMEEALDQDVDLFWPAAADAALVTRAHEIYARTQGSGHLLSVALRVDEVPVAVMGFERRERAFDANEAWELRLIGEACARSLAALHDRDRWIGARVLARLATWRDLMLGPSHTAWKIAGLALVAVIGMLALLPWPYRIDSPLALRSKDVIFIPAPFDAYLRDAHIEVGDVVKAGDPLVQLDTRELVLEEAMIAADAVRFGREAEKAQAARQFADMQISLAREQQASSKLELIRFQLANATMRAPFEGVVVEGDLKKNLGAPVRKGDLLVKLARTGETYLELEIDQADVHEVEVGMRGEFAFVGRPDQRYPLVIERVDPAATMREGRNVYLARAAIEADIQPWWRPGMGGSARLDAGERSTIWILTRRTVRYLRHLFWI
jgi:multidrug resistance efflux pump